MDSQQPALYTAWHRVICPASSAPDLRDRASSMVYPILISSAGIVVGLVTLILQKIIYPVKDMPDVEKALKGILVISTILMTPVAIYLSQYCLPGEFSMGQGCEKVQWYYCAIPGSDYVPA